MIKYLYRRIVAGLRLSRVVAAVFAATLVTAGSAHAQLTDAEIAQIGDANLGASTWAAAACQQSHGWAGDGIGTVPQYEGPSLRDTYLTPEAMIETIKCGRPGTAMPTWRMNAWTEIVPCYGMTEPMAQFAPPPGERTYSDRAINAMVAFIFRDFVGHGPVTREYCVQRLGDGSPLCPGYPTAAEVAAAAEPSSPTPMGPVESEH